CGQNSGPWPRSTWTYVVVRGMVWICIHKIRWFVPTDPQLTNHCFGQSFSKSPVVPPFFAPVEDLGHIDPATKPRFWPCFADNRVVFMSYIILSLDHRGRVSIPAAEENP